MNIKKITLPVITILSFIFMISLNALANILPINGYHTGELSAMYPNLFVPAGITFGIWGVIYLQLFVFTIYLVYKSYKNYSNNKKLSFLYINSCILNGLWILAWHYKLILLSVIIMLLLLITLIFLYMLPRPFSVKDKVIISSAFSVYLGWISVATIANISAYLVHLGWTGNPFSEVTLTVIMIIVASILSAIFVLKEKDIIYPIVTIWALYGITIKRLASQTPEVMIINTCYILMIILISLITYSIITKKTYFNTEY